jgi:hypothetical protein
MRDDCYNAWGCHLVPSSKPKRSSSTVSEGERDLRPLRDKITQTLNEQFVLRKVMSCGSDANMYAIFSASNGDTSRCLVAASSYIAGDDGPLQCWPTNTLILKEVVSTISTPGEVRNPFTRRQTVALPYCIPGVLSAKRQREYKNACFKELQVLCFLAKMKAAHYKCIMLELMLAGNGAWSDCRVS